MTQYTMKTILVGALTLAFALALGSWIQSSFAAAAQLIVHAGK